MTFSTVTILNIDDFTIYVFLRTDVIVVKVISFWVVASYTGKILVVRGAFRI